MHDGIGAMPDGIGLCLHTTVPARAGHGWVLVEQARRLCGDIVRILRRLSEPPGGRRWHPEGGSASLDAMGGRLHDGIGALPVRILRPQGLGTVELARRPCGGIVRILQRLSEPPGGRRWPPEGGSASLDAMGGGVHDGIGALPPHRLFVKF